MNGSPTPPSIVVGIDGSKAAINAALWAIDEAVSRDIPLRLLYAIEPDDTQQTRPERAARKLAIAENAVRYAFMVVEGADRPVKIEVEITQERAITSLIRASASAAMVCIGAVGAHHFRPDRVGSTAGPWPYRRTALWPSSGATAIGPQGMRGGSSLTRKGLPTTALCWGSRSRKHDCATRRCEQSPAGKRGSAISAMWARPETMIAG